jgi:hypothetical protein
MDAVMADQRFNADVVVGDRTQALLRSRGLLPSQWKVSDVERQRILDNNIKLGLVFPPASQLSLTAASASVVKRIYVVTIELKALDAYEFTQREIIATILHEIGHVVNPNPPSGVSNCGEAGAEITLAMLREMYADDYARFCGFGNEIASSLKKCSEKNPSEFKPDQIEARIRRIAEKVDNSMRS